MPDKYKCDKCEKTFNKPIQRQHEEVVPDLYGHITGVTITGAGLSASGAWFPPGKREWTTKHCPFCDSKRFSEWFEGYINWEDYF